jgi:phosphoserine aminotransferase
MNGTVVEQGIWRKISNQELRQLYKNLDIVADIKKKSSYKKIQQDATVYKNLLFCIYMKLNMFRATHHPSSGA